MYSRARQHAFQLRASGRGKSIWFKCTPRCSVGFAAFLWTFLHSEGIYFHLSRVTGRKRFLLQRTAPARPRHQGGLSCSSGHVHAPWCLGWLRWALGLPAVDHHGAGVRRGGGLHSPDEGQQAGGVIRHPVLRPGGEVELPHLVLGGVSPLSTHTHTVTFHVKHSTQKLQSSRPFQLCSVMDGGRAGRSSRTSLGTLQLASTGSSAPLLLLHREK